MEYQLPLLRPTVSFPHVELLIPTHCGIGAIHASQLRPGLPTAPTNPFCCFIHLTSLPCLPSSDITQKGGQRCLCTRLQGTRTRGRAHAWVVMVLFSPAIASSPAHTGAQGSPSATLPLKLNRVEVPITSVVSAQELHFAHVSRAIAVSLFQPYNIGRCLFVNYVRFGVSSTENFFSLPIPVSCPWNGFAFSTQPTRGR